MSLAAFHETETVYAKILRIRIGQKKPPISVLNRVLTAPKGNLGKNGGVPLTSFLRAGSHPS